MKFALFYEIPVARPWNEKSEYHAFKDIPHEKVMQTIELMGQHVLPEFRK